MKSLILASTSPYRREQLQRLVLPFETLAPEVNEDEYKNQGLTPEVLAKTLATAKAQAVFETLDDKRDIAIIGGDQVAEIDGKILGKPGNRENAISQLKELSGKTHHLHTALTIKTSEKTFEHTETAKLTLFNLSESQIERYVEKDLPLYSCGSYKIESYGISLFESIEVTDFTSIVGLPMLFLNRTLRELGFQFP
ncbi:MAG: Maf family protein [Bacteriovoracaceae bacterium]